MKTILSIMCFALATGLSANAAAQRAFDLQLVGPDKRLTEGNITTLSRCKLVYHLKAGMTNSEAVDAIDAGFNKFFSCLRTASLKAKASK